MTKDQITFNDIPAIVGELCERFESLESLLKSNLNAPKPEKENLHVPMTVKEACEYLGISKSSFYFKCKHGGIPVIKQGKHLFIYRDELDKWLESARKTPVPRSFEEEHEALMAKSRRKAKPLKW